MFQIQTQFLKSGHSQICRFNSKIHFLYLNDIQFINNIMIFIVVAGSLWYQSNG